jgi:DNA-binding MarR family transcriptional regulator
VTSTAEWTQSAPLTALLRAAWLARATAVRQALAGAGFDDMPRNGGYVLSAVAAAEVPLSAVISQLGMSKQAAGQLVDTLVLRGYLDRSVDPADRRRLVVAPTGRGEAAAAVIRAAATSLDAALEAQVGAAQLAHARTVLAALASAGGPGA